MKMVKGSLDGPEVEVSLEPKWSDESLRLARRVAMARWRNQGWSAARIAAVFSFSASYVRRELASLESSDGVSDARAVCMPRTRRRLTDPEARVFRHRTMFDLRQHGLSPVEIAKFFSCTADHVRKELARPEPTGPDDAGPFTQAKRISRD